MKTKETSSVLNHSDGLFPKVVAAIGLALLGTLAIQAGQGPQPSICTRSCWGARASTGCGTMSTLDRAMVHHTAGTADYTTDFETGKARVRGIQNMHMDINGWCDIGYHFLIDAGGSIYEGRYNSMAGLPIGTHDGCYVNSFGFSVLGYYHPPYYQTFTSASRASLEAVIAWRMPSAWSPYGTGTYCGASVGFLDGHRMVGATACPGDIIFAEIPALRDGVNARKNPPPAAVNPPSAIRLSNGAISVHALMTAGNGSIQYRQQAGLGQAWTAWIDLGGTGFKHIKAVAIGSGGQAVFGTGGNEVWWRYKSSSTICCWNAAWINLGGTGFQKVAPVYLSDGRLAVYAVGNGSPLWYKEQTSAGVTAPWSGWVNLSGVVFSQVDAVPYGSGSTVYACEEMGPVWQKYQSSAFGAWSGWVNMGGVVNRVKAVRKTDGNSAVFGCGASPIGYNEGAGWVTLTGSGFRELSAVPLNNGGLAVFGCGNGTGPIYYRAKSSSGAAWGVAVDLGGSGLVNMCSVADANARMVCFARGGLGGSLWDRWMTDATHWGAWQNLYGALK